MSEPRTTHEFFADWTDKMIANHFGQSRTRKEIEEIVGRQIDWNETQKSNLDEAIAYLNDIIPAPDPSKVAYDYSKFMEGRTANLKDVVEAIIREAVDRAKYG